MEIESLGVIYINERDRLEREGVKESYFVLRLS